VTTNEIVDSSDDRVTSDGSGDPSPGPSRNLGPERAQDLETVRENCPGDAVAKSTAYVPPFRRGESSKIESTRSLLHLSERKGLTDEEIHQKSQILSNLILYLDDLEPIRQVTLEQECSSCGSSIGELDESKLILVPKSLGGSLVKRFTRYDSLKQTTSTFIGADGIFKVPALQGGATYLGSYEVRNAIVNSGIWSREQLSGQHFSQHELEVNDRSFYHIRPHLCHEDVDEASFWREAGVAEEDLDYWLGLSQEEDLPGLHANPHLGVSVDFLPGSLSPDRSPGEGSELGPTELLHLRQETATGTVTGDCNNASSKDDASLAAIARVPSHQCDDWCGRHCPHKPTPLTGVETEFISGNSVRTGFRRRSIAASLLRKRRKKRMNSSSGVTVQVRLQKSRLIPGHLLGLIPRYLLPEKEQYLIKLDMSKHMSRMLRRRYHKRHFRTSRPNRSPLIRGVTLVRRPPKPGFEKYSYFFRKRGYYYLSKHHPLQGDWGS